MQSGREKEAARLLSERNRLRKAEQEATRLQRVVKTHFPSSISPPIDWFTKVPKLMDFIREWISLGKNSDIHEYGGKILSLMWNNLGVITANPAQRKHAEKACELFLKEKELDDVKRELEAAGVSLGSLQAGDMVVLPRTFSGLNVSAIDQRIARINAAITGAQKDLLLSRLPAGPLKDLYGVFKDAHKKISEINSISSDIYSSFFNTIQQFLYDQAALSEDKHNSAAIANHFRLLQAIGKLADNLHEFDPEKYNNLEVASYCSHETSPPDPILEIFAKSKGILAESVSDQSQALLEEITAKIDKISIFMQQIKDTQASIGSLQLGVEKIPEPEKALFQAKLDEQKRVIVQLNSDDPALQQKTQEIQKILGQLEIMGGLVTALHDLDDAEVQVGDETEVLDTATAKLLTRLSEMLSNPSDVDIAAIAEQIESIKETRSQEAYERKERENSNTIDVALKAIDQVEKEFKELGGNISDREKLVELLKKLADIKEEIAAVMEGRDVAREEDEEESKLQGIDLRVKVLEQEIQDLVTKIDKLEAGVKERERREQAVPKQACAYAKLAFAVNAVDQALKLKGIKPSVFEREYGSMSKALRVEAGEKKDMWSIFNVLLQQENIKKLTFDSENRAEVVVTIASRIFKVTLRKVTSTTGTIIPNKFDIQLQQYRETPSGVGIAVELGPEFFKTPLRISRRGTLLVAVDSATKATVVKDQLVDRNHQVDAMLRTVGMQMDSRGEIHPISEPSLKGKHAQLIIAGTGAGKSGMIATTAMVHGRGVFATQSGKLVDGMVNDLNDFIKKEDGSPAAIKLPSEDPAHPGQPLSKGDVVKFLDEHPYTVMTHDQLILYADILKDQNVYIDEVHSIVPKSYERGSEEKMAALRTIIANNSVLGTTATPTTQVRELLGKPIYDLSLHDAQTKLKTVRAIATEDTVVAEAKLAEETVNKLLTRSTKLKPGMIGYSQKNTKGNIRVGSHTQGFVFTDDSELAGEIHQHLSDKKGANAKVYDGVVATQHKIIECNVKIDIIVNLRVSDKNRKDLQQLVRNERFDELDAIYKESLEKYRFQQLRKEGYIRSARNKIDTFCSAREYGFKIKSLYNQKNFNVLMHNEEFQALFAAYKKAVEKKYSNPEERTQKIRAFRIAVNNSGYAGLRDQCQNLGVDRPFKRLFPGPKAFDGLIQDKTLREAAGKQNFQYLQKDGSYIELYNIYMAAVRKNHKGDDEKTKKEKIAEAEKIFKDLMEREEFTELKRIFNKEVEESYQTSWTYQREKKENPGLVEYYNSVEGYFNAGVERRGRTNERGQQAIIDRLQSSGCISTLLDDSSTDDAEKKAASLLEKGLTMYVVSTGRLGTGYSNPNLLSTVVVQKHPIGEVPPSKNPVIKRVQCCGRPIREPDGVAFGTSITSSAIPESGRNLTFAQVYSTQATDAYIERTQAFEDYWAPTMEKTKELSVVLENLKDTIKKLPIDKAKVQEALDLVDKFDIDVKVKVRAIDKRVQALDEKIKKAACSAEELDSSIKEITADIKAIDVGNLIADLEASQSEPLPHEVQEGLAGGVSGEITKLQSLQAEKLKNLRVVQAVRVFNAVADGIVVRVRQFGDKVQTAEASADNLKATNLRALLEELKPERGKIVEELEAEREKLEGIKRGPDWAGLDEKTKTELEQALLRINLLRDTEVKELIEGFGRIESLAKARELTDSEIRGQVTGIEQEIERLTVAVEGMVAGISAVLNDKYKKTQEIRDFAKTTEETITMMLDGLKAQQDALGKIKIKESLEKDLQEQIHIAKTNMVLLGRQIKQVAVTEPEKINQAMQNRLEEDKKVLELIQALDRVATESDRQIDEINAVPIKTAQNLEGVIQRIDALNIANRAAVLKKQQEILTSPKLENIAALPAETQAALDNVLQHVKTTQEALAQAKSRRDSLVQMLPKVKEVEAYAARIAAKLQQIAQAKQNRASLSVDQLDPLLKGVRELVGEANKYVSNSSLSREMQQPLTEALERIKIEQEELEELAQACRKEDESVSKMIEEHRSAVASIASEITQKREQIANVQTSGGAMPSATLDKLVKDITEFERTKDINLKQHLHDLSQLEALGLGLAVKKLQADVVEATNVQAKQLNGLIVALEELKNLAAETKLQETKEEEKRISEQKELERLAQARRKEDESVSKVIEEHRSAVALIASGIAQKREQIANAQTPGGTMPAVALDKLVEDISANNASLEEHLDGLLQLAALGLDPNMEKRLEGAVAEAQDVQTEQLDLIEILKVLTEEQRNVEKDEAAAAMQREKQANVKLEVLRKLNQDLDSSIRAVALVEKQITEVRSVIKTGEVVLENFSEDSRITSDELAENLKPSIKAIKDIEVTASLALQEQQRLLKEISQKAAQLELSGGVGSSIKAKLEDTLSEVQSMQKSLPSITADRERLEAMSARIEALETLAQTDKDLVAFKKDLQEYRTQRLQGIVGWFRRTFTSEEDKLNSSQKRAEEALKRLQKGFEEVGQSDLKGSAASEALAVAKQKARETALMEQQVEKELGTQLSRKSKSIIAQ